jgi:hypothetical protein
MYTKLDPNPELLALMPGTTAVLQLADGPRVLCGMRTSAPLPWVTVYGFVLALDEEGRVMLQPDGQQVFTDYAYDDTRNFAKDGLDQVQKDVLLALIGEPTTLDLGIPAGASIRAKLPGAQPAQASVHDLL